MWVFTPRGFYSVVQKPGDREEKMLTIRTRNRGDINALADLLPNAKPYQVRHSDYAWRVRVPAEEWANALAVMAGEVTYSNFKDEVTKRQGRERHDVYLRIWSTLLTIVDRPKGRRRSRTAGTRRFADEER